MPELPEIEVVRRSLSPYLQGISFTSIISRVKSLRYPVEIHANLSLLNSTVKDIRRYGRYIVIELDNLSGLIIHLGMTGKLRTALNETPLEKHEHIIFNLSNNSQLRYESVRKFGYVESCNFPYSGARPDSLASLGPEPLSNEFTTEYLSQICRIKRTAIKTILMDNKQVTGLGNIYATESLFKAQISPFIPANKLPLQKREKLVMAIKQTLQSAIDTGVEYNLNKTSLDGEEWHFPTNAHIYGKADTKCTICSDMIKSKKQSGRTTFFCPTCQKQE